MNGPHRFFFAQRHGHGACEVSISALVRPVQVQFRQFATQLRELPHGHLLPRPASGEEMAVGTKAHKSEPHRFGRLERDEFVAGRSVHQPDAIAGLGKPQPAAVRTNGCVQPESVAGVGSPDPSAPPCAGRILDPFCRFIDLHADDYLWRRPNRVGTFPSGDRRW